MQKQEIKCLKCSKVLKPQNCPSHEDNERCLECWGTGFVVECKECCWQWRGEKQEENEINHKHLSEMTPIEYLEYRLEELKSENEPVHNWFGLTYSSYLVLQRTLLQSMPTDWQQRFISLIKELEFATEGLEIPGTFTVNAKDEKGKFIYDDPSKGGSILLGRFVDDWENKVEIFIPAEKIDDLRDYERGRRQVKIKPEYLEWLEKR